MMPVSGIPTVFATEVDAHVWSELREFMFQFQCLPLVNDHFQLP